MTIAHVDSYEHRWAEALNRGDLSIADEIFTHDCIVHMTGIPEPIVGVEVWTQVVAGLLAAFPDLHFTIDEQLEVGDRVATRWHARGTHTQPLGPMPATGRAIAIEGLILDHLVAGKVSERWEQYDQSVMLLQLGVA